MSKIEEAMDLVRSAPVQTAQRQRARTRSVADTTPSRLGAELAHMTQPREWTAAERAAAGILDFHAPGAAGTDAFRQLRVAVAERIDRRNPLIGVTGVVRSAGASFISRNLAAAFALDRGRSALLIDCDLADTSNSKLVLAERKSPAAKGLCDYLFDESLDEAAIIQPSGWPRLRVIPTGGMAPDSGEIFTAPRLQTLFEALQRRYADRTVILDMPPAGEVADARILAQLCDGLVLVVPYARVDADTVDAAIERIGPDRLIGTVFNQDPVGSW